jgi:hypothetical protein
MLHMRGIGCVLVLALTARPAPAQLTTAADSAALVTAVVADLRAFYSSAKTGVFVTDSGRYLTGPLARRIALLLRSDATFDTTHTTPRLAWSEPSVRGDTATVSVIEHRCHEGTRIRYSGNNATHRYIRINARWTVESPRSVTHGDGMRCPWE